MEDYEGQDGAATVASLKQYLWSIVYMPSALRSDIVTSGIIIIKKTILINVPLIRWLCLTNLFCWSSLVCYSLYFTDFVGQAVFGGNPR